MSGDQLVEIKRTDSAVYSLTPPCPTVVCVGLQPDDRTAKHAGADVTRSINYPLYRLSLLDSDPVIRSKHCNCGFFPLAAACDATSETSKC